MKSTLILPIYKATKKSKSIPDGFLLEDLFPDGMSVASSIGPSLKGAIPALKKILGGSWININDFKYPFNYDRLGWITSIIFQIYVRSDGSFIQINREGERRNITNPNRSVMAYIGHIYHTYGIYGNAESLSEFFDARMWSPHSNNLIRDPRHRKYLKLSEEQWATRLIPYKFDIPTSVETQLMLNYFPKEYRWKIEQVSRKVDFSFATDPALEKIKDFITANKGKLSGFIPTQHICDFYVNENILPADSSTKLIVNHFNKLIDRLGLMSVSQRITMSGKKVSGRQLYKITSTIVSTEEVASYSILDD